jgi:hypothetical protein
MAYKILREIRKDLPRFCGRQIAIDVNPRVAEVLLARAHKACADLGRELGCEIEIRGQSGLHQEQFEVTALDSGPPVSIPLQWLGFPPEPGDERASTAELKIEANEPASAAEPDTPGPTDPAADEPEPSPNAEATPAPTAEATPAPTELEASPEAAEEEMGDSVTAPEPAVAESAHEPAAPESTPAVASSEQASPESTRVAASSEQASPESTQAEVALEAAPPEDDSTAETAIAANAEAAESEERFAATAPAVEMLDLEPKTPILPHPAKVEET